MKPAHNAHLQGGSRVQCSQLALKGCVAIAASSLDCSCLYLPYNSDLHVTQALKWLWAEQPRSPQMSHMQPCPLLGILCFAGCALNAIEHAQKSLGLQAIRQPFATSAGTFTSVASTRDAVVALGLHGLAC